MKPENASIHRLHHVSAVGADLSDVTVTECAIHRSNSDIKQTKFHIGSGIGSISL